MRRREQRKTTRGRLRKERNSYVYACVQVAALYEQNEAPDLANLAERFRAKVAKCALWVSKCACSHRVWAPAQSGVYKAAASPPCRRLVPFLVLSQTPKYAHAC
eukprot:611639-Pleurochrysis_carterae.AAC.1